MVGGGGGGGGGGHCLKLILNSLKSGDMLVLYAYVFITKNPRSQGAK